SPGEYRHIRDHNAVFSGMLATSANRISLRVENGATETVDSESVSGSYFPVLGIPPAIGRLISADDGRADSDDSRVAVVSWSYWKDRFQFDTAALGKRIHVGNSTATIIGVAPREFSGLRVWLRTQVWLSGGEGGALIGRLRHGVTIGQAAA